MVSTDHLALLLIGVGVVLVASPVAVFSADIGAPTYEYEATELSHEDGSFDIPPVLTTTFSIENIACVGESRACKLERNVYEQGRLPVEDAGVDARYYEFVYLNDSFYRTETVEENGTVSLTHEPVTADTAIRRSSTTYGIAEPSYQTAVDSGHVTTTARLERGAIITKNADSPNEQFYYVYATRTPGAGEHGPGLSGQLLTYGLAGVGLLGGLALVGRGQRIRVRSQLRQ